MGKWFRNLKNPAATIFGAILGAIGLIIVGVIGIQASLAPKRLEIRTTQTAEARATEMASALTQTAIYSRLPIDTTIDVFSARYPFASSDIVVEEGDRLEITVIGDDPTWNCGRDTNTDPMGHTDGPYSDLVFGSANPCALIGSISSSSPDSYFLVGEHYLDEAVTESGMLFLGCNDSDDRFGDNPTDSRLTVHITVSPPAP